MNEGARLPRDERGRKRRDSVHLIRLVPNVVTAVDYVATEVQATFQNQADFMRLRNPTEKAVWSEEKKREVCERGKNLSGTQIPRTRPAALVINT